MIHYLSAPRNLAPNFAFNRSEQRFRNIQSVAFCVKRLESID